MFVEKENSIRVIDECIGPLSAGASCQEENAAAFVDWKKTGDSYLRIIKARIVNALLPPGGSPVVAARGAFIGMFIAMTPTVGIQVLLVSVLWSVFQALKKWRFNYTVAFTLTWVTNYATAVPLYFLFYYTGVFLSGFFMRETALTYNEFAVMLDPFLSGTSFNMLPLLAAIFSKIFMPMMIGSLPYAITLSFLAYKTTLFIYKKHRYDVYYSEES